MARKKKTKTESKISEDIKEEPVVELDQPEEPVVELDQPEEPVVELDQPEEPVVELEEIPVIKKDETKKVVQKPKDIKDLEVYMTIEDASRRFVKGFKEQWLPSINAFAKKQYNITGKIPESKCKSILIAWGAKII